MKKGLLLSLVASTMIFAGGDIAPVEPAAAAPAADCSDFYGSIGAYYRTISADSGDLFATDVAGNANAFSVTAVVGVEKTLFDGIGFGAEAAGWSNLGLWDGADLAPIGARGGDGSLEGGELSQLYLTVSFNNTAIKAGRFALPLSLSPWAWSDRTAGVLDTTFEGALVANTDLADTTVYGAVVTKTINGGTRAQVGDDSALVAVGLVNKSLANTTISAVGYYIPDVLVGAGELAAYAGFVTVDTKVAGVNFSSRAAVVSRENDATIVPDVDATFGIDAVLSGKAGIFNWSVAAAYINDGDMPLNAVTGYGALRTDNEEASETAVWQQTFAGAPIGTKSSQVQLLAKISTKVGIGSLYGSVQYVSYDVAQVVPGNAYDSSTGVRAGYKFKVAGINTKIEYRYRNRATTVAGAADMERHQVRIEAQYKF